MNKVILHNIQQGERWDSLAYRYYGSVAEMNRLINANPHLALAEVLPQGETLLVPVLSVEAVNQNDLPPWLQGAK